MGSGATKGPTAVGAPMNPRVQYSHKLEKREKKKVLVDAPVLVDVQHGSVRYRQAQGETQPVKSLKGKEHPYENDEGKDLDNKENYFYHTRLDKYGNDANKDSEQKFKFYYVTKGPASAQAKKLFYVFGKGWDAKDGSKLKPTETVGMGRDFAWSSTRQPNALYYTMSFEDCGEEETSEEDKILADLKPSPDKSSIKLTVNIDETISVAKARLAVRLLKSTRDVHISFNNKELRDEDVISSFYSKENNIDDAIQTSESPTSFNIKLVLV